MIVSAVFKCKLDNLTCPDAAALRDVLLRIGEAIQTIEPSAAIHPDIEVRCVSEPQQTALGAADVECLLDVKRKNGQHEYQHVVGGVAMAITKDQYNEHTGAR